MAAHGALASPFIHIFAFLHFLLTFTTDAPASPACLACLVLPFQNLREPTGFLEHLYMTLVPVYQSFTIVKGGCFGGAKLLCVLRALCVESDPDAPLESNPLQMVPGPALHGSGPLRQEASFSGG